MGIAGSCLNLRVTEELANHWQAFAAKDTIRGEGVPQIMDANVVQTGGRPNAAPWMLKIGQV